MKTCCPEFEPIDVERAQELKTVINRAGSRRHAVLIDPDEGGLTAVEPPDLISASENTNALVRYRRHY